MLFRLATCLLAGALASACVDQAAENDTTQATSGAVDRPGGAARKPPPEALAACQSLAADASCAFDIDGHHVDGTCKTGPDGNGPLACAPARPPLPPEALAACQSLAADASCAFDIDGHHVDGTCKTGPDGNGPLACAPANPLPPPR